MPLGFEGNNSSKECKLQTLWPSLSSCALSSSSKVFNPTRKTYWSSVGHLIQYFESFWLSAFHQWPNEDKPLSNKQRTLHQQGHAQLTFWLSLESSFLSVKWTLWKNYLYDLWLSSHLRAIEISPSTHTSQQTNGTPASGPRGGHMVQIRPFLVLQCLITVSSPRRGHLTNSRVLLQKFLNRSWERERERCSISPLVSQPDEYGPQSCQ